MPQKSCGARVVVKTGDITREEVDAIVNAANSGLMGGAGVDGAIRRAGGPTITAECAKIIRTAHPTGLPVGEAVITTAGDLLAHRVIHTVGPRWTGGSDGEPELRRNCYTNALRLAVDNDLASVAFPAISTGIYGYPPDQAAVVASSAVRDFLASEPRVELVAFVLFGQDAFDTFVEHAKF
jgi:O-acetyl-ADP-ribose deacetylase (regulator of RNase III)